MTDLLAARSQMAISLAFHIIFAVAGMGMPLLMVLAEAAWLRTGDALYLDLAKRQAKATAILFAVGAVSGTVLSFELGLLWPEFMELAGPYVALPFSLEGFAFFFEAVFLGIYLYGWERVSARAHLLAGVGVLLSGIASAAFVVCANAWMNSPVLSTMVDPITGTSSTLITDPIAAMFNPAAPSQVLHMVVAAFVSIGFMVAGIHAWYLLRDPDTLLHRRGHAIALIVAIVAGMAQPITGHRSAEFIAQWQPVKLAAAEAQWETQRHAPLRIGGWPDEEAETTRWSLEIPGMLSLLAFGELSAEVQGLKATPRDDRPPVAAVHLAWQVMLGLGTLMATVSLISGLMWLLQGHAPRPRWLLYLHVLLAPAGLICVEAGWVVTEVGRQPWVIQGVMRTSDAVTPVQGIPITLGLYLSVYAGLTAMTLLLLRRQLQHAPTIHPHDPPPPVHP